MASCGFDRRAGRYGERDAVLTIPAKDKWAWEPHERHKRSLVQDATTGEVLSRGFPKFHNLGEVPAEDAETEQAFAEGRVVLREKLDGSLIIRDVVDGRVCWRTRGALGLGEFEGRVMALVEAGPAWLTNPRSYTAESVLFEYTSPENRIVVRYRTPALTLLARVDRVILDHGGGYWSGVTLFDDVRRFESMNGLAHVRGLVERGGVFDEGVVVACYRAWGVKLVKMKSAEYIRLHSLMTECTRAKVFDLLEREGVVTPAACRVVLEAAGFDWEAMQDARGWAEEYAERCHQVHLAVSAISQRLAALAGADRKTVALEMKALTADMMPGAFALAMAMRFGTQDSWGDNAAAMRCDVPLNVYRARQVPR